MKNTLFALALCATTISCNQAEPAQEQAETGIIGTVADGVIDANFMTQIAMDDDKYKSEIIKIDDGTYDKMQDFILKHGFRIKYNDVQYTFWDSNGNRHGMVVIQRPNTGDFREAKPAQISVWVNGPHTDADKTKEFFGYFIHPGDTMLLETTGDKAHRAEILDAISEFVTKKM